MKSRDHEAVDVARKRYSRILSLMKLYVEYDKRCEMREREEMIRVKSIEIIDLKRMMQEMAKTLNKKSMTTLISYDD
jgi:hypothetical protein